MHIIETFSLATGLQIDKPEILEHYFPLGLDQKYITIQPFGKFDSRKYDYWNEVMHLLYPVLSANDIYLLQIGGKNEPRLDNCVYVSGQTSYNQTAYLIRRSVLHLGVDSFAIHIASGLNKKIVGLYCNMYTQNSRPYWSKDEDVILLEADRKGDKPTFASQEHPKSINTITPESIAGSVCELLGLDFSPKFKTVYIGENYPNKTYEMVPTHPVDLRIFNLDSVILRMDLMFNEDILKEQLERGPCSVLTNKPIKIELLKKYKSRIKEFVYLIDENSNADYVRYLRSNGIAYALYSFLRPEELERYKLDYIDYGNIIQRPRKQRSDAEKLKNKKDEDLFYVSGKHYLLGDLAFWRKDPDFNSKPIKNSNSFIPQPIPVNNPSFWDNLDCYHILEKA